MKSLVVLSNHKKFEALQPLKKSLSKLRRLQRKLARSEKGSKNRIKLVWEISELHRRIFNYRQNALHQLTNYLTTHFSRIVIEDLNVSGMLKNGKLARCIADVGFYEFRRQLLYKAERRGCEVIVADRYFASSKTCGYCGQKHEALKLSDRQWRCPHCGTEIKDRDFNAAINIPSGRADFNESGGAASYAVNALGCKEREKTRNVTQGRPERFSQESVSVKDERWLRSDLK